MSKLESIEVHELARMMATWADYVGEEVSRRALLLKIGTSLSIAAMSPVMIGESERVSKMQPADGSAFSGIWHSGYIYPSTGRGDDFTGEHYVVLRSRKTALLDKVCRIRGITTPNRTRPGATSNHRIVAGTVISQ
jgi:hypothetical protein